MSKVKITETSLRDGHQSLMATRMTTAEMLPIIETMDKAGYHAMEVWGGATYDAAIRFLNEDPWERLREIRKRTKNTKLQMLLRGQNLLGYRHYADDIVDKFVELSIKNGIDIIRIFDDTPVVLEIAGFYLGINSLAYVAYGTINVSGSTLQAIKRPVAIFLLNGFRQFVLQGSLFYAVVFYFDLEIKFIWLALFFSVYLTAICFVFWTLYQLRRATGVSF